MSSSVSLLQPAHRPALPRCAPLVGWLCAALLIGACESEEKNDGKAADAAADAEAARLFAMDQVFEVAIEVAPADMDKVRADNPGLTHYLEPTCRQGPRPGPFEYVPATVTIDGKRFEGAEIRKKGFLGSMEPRRPSFKVRLAKGAKIAGMRKLTLNNNMQVGNYVAECLTYKLFRKAGLVAPRCGYAHVTVNGEDHGVYVHIESLGSPFLERNFEDPTGHLYEHTLADYEDAALHIIEWKNDNENTDRPYLQAIADVLAKSPDATLLDDLGKYVDLDAFFRFWAMEVLTGHWDGYNGNRNNSYAYWQPANGKLYFLPWGVDASLRDSNNFWGGALDEAGKMPRAVYAHSAFARRLYAHDDAGKRYFEALGAVVKEVWDETALLADIDTVLATLKPYIAEREMALVEQRSGSVRTFIQDQRAALQPAIDGAHPTWELSTAQLPICGTDTMVVEGEFETTWGTADKDPLKHGSGSMSEINSGKKSPLSIVVGTAGTVPWPIPGDLVQILVGAGPIGAGGFIALEIKVMPSLIVKGTTVPLDYGLAGASAAKVDLGTMKITPFGYVLGGEVTFLEAGTNDGDVIKLKIRAPIGAMKVVPMPKKT